MGGVLVDYLIPTVYLTDILIFFLILFWDLDILVNKPRYKFNVSVLSIFLTLFVFIVTLSFSVTSYPSLFKFIKYFELILFFLYTGLSFDLKVNFEKIATVFSLSILFESSLGFLQWLSGSSVFNNYLFFGEQPYNYKTAGIIHESFLGFSKIPPYGTFPHPNVFGGFLSIFLVAIIYFSITNKKLRTLHVGAVLYGFLTLILIQSTAAWVSLGVGLGFLILVKLFGRKALLVGAALIVMLNLGLLSANNTKISSYAASVYRRQDLIESSVLMIKAKPLTGVGLNLFTSNLEKYKKVRGPIRFIQPVHNIFLLLLAESGVFPFLAFLLFLKNLFTKSLEKGVSALPVVLILQLLILGTFDHYLLTIQQGMLLFWLTLGIALSTIVVNANKLAQLKD